MLRVPIFIIILKSHGENRDLTSDCQRLWLNFESNSICAQIEADTPKRYEDMKKVCVRDGEALEV